MLSFEFPQAEAMVKSIDCEILKFCLKLGKNRNRAQPI